jgi:superfamily II DNA or RNA helicase
VSLLSQVSNLFSEAVKQRGHRYASEGRVCLAIGSADAVAATVHGHEAYDVTLDRQRDSVVAACSCPFVISWGKPCKHIWAVALAADKHGLLTGDGSLVSSLRTRPLLEEPPWSERPLVETRRRARILWQPGQILPDYGLDAEASAQSNALVVHVSVRPRSKRLERASGRYSILHHHIERLPDPFDRQILSILKGGISDSYRRPYQLGPSRMFLPYQWSIPRSLAAVVLPLLCATRRFTLKGVEPAVPLTLDDGEPWELWIEMAGRPVDGYLLKGSLRRGEHRVPLSEVDAVAGGHVVFHDHIARLDDQGASAWLPMLRRTPERAVRPDDLPGLLDAFLTAGIPPRLELPEELRLERRQVRPALRLRLRVVDVPRTRVQAELMFQYGPHQVPGHAHLGHIVDVPGRSIWIRDLRAEQLARDRLLALSLRPDRAWEDERSMWRVRRDRVGDLVRTLVADQWLVEAEGKLHRAATAWASRITSGTDWFGLRADLQFGDETVPLPAILAALKRGESFVRLGDGSFGLLPEEWLARYGLLAQFADAEDGILQFRPNQIALLEALLAACPEIEVDEGFEKARERLRGLTSPHPVDASPEFAGRLREYQKDGLGWMRFLRESGFGGCLADDMGLGKTVQVLALLDGRRDHRTAGPSLIVAPRSLVFNWMQEAARFTPQVRLLDHTGGERRCEPEAFPPGAAVITTYGTLRRDISWLSGISFDYVILDEAQAIKNARSQSAKAVRLLRADHRLALSGTPVENHLGELWSLFEFLNPGLLGRSSVLSALSRRAAPDAAELELISRAVGPFILRRTKQQVAPELPERVEQTLPCVLEGRQRRAYDELATYFRETLRRQVERDGMARAQMDVLEALLRLRQAACHPGLIDPARTHEPSAKLNVLLPRLLEVMEEGHKALVFSQFTSFLAILRRQLDLRGLRYAYLDGATRDRQAIVTRFQTDPDLKLFLISLKAGGLGLNLTAAEYVYLLDPWWNPAVEAQAIDRAHRIGQSRRVMACRLVAKDTVEERILELQRSKRDLAESIIRADAGLLRHLKIEDLERLLS